MLACWLGLLLLTATAVQAFAKTRSLFSRYNCPASHACPRRYDKNIRLWDTETGTVLRTLNTGKIFYCARFHPEQQNVVMAGCGDKKIYQFDADTGDVMQVRPTRVTI